MPSVKKVETTADLNKLLDTVFTESEKEMILRRMLVVKMLNDGMQYREIERKLEISKITISRVKDIIKERGYGRNPQRKRIKTSYHNPAYDNRGRKIKSKPLLGHYKGARSII